jgi:antitoxin YefM
MSSSVTIDEVYKEVKKIRADMVRREDLEALAETVEILSNPATMQLIRKSKEDIKHGRVKEISSVDDLFSESSLKKDWLRPEEDEAWADL